MFGKIMTRIWSTKHWWNSGELCDTKHHVSYAPYRRYRRGKKRCHDCGYKLGKPVLKRESYSERLVDNIYSGNPLLAMLSAKGKQSSKP